MCAMPIVSTTKVKMSHKARAQQRFLHIISEREWPLQIGVLNKFLQMCKQKQIVLNDMVVGAHSLLEHVIMQNDFALLSKVLPFSRVCPFTIEFATRHNCNDDQLRILLDNLRCFDMEALTPSIDILTERGDDKQTSIIRKQFLLDNN